MALLDLPVDLFHEVLLRAVIVRGVTRALRLKLVCKQFQRYLQPALFESRLLDGFLVEPRKGSRLDFMEDWYIRNRHGAEKFWHAYLVYRVRNETDPNKGGFVSIRQISERICEQTETDHETVINALCWLALERGSNAPGFSECWGWTKPGDKKLNASSSLLSAAAFLGNIEVVRQLLSEGICPTVKGPLFPSPIQLATYIGSSDVLRLFQENLPEFEGICPLGIKSRDYWGGKIEPGSIKGAMMRGDIDMLRLAIFPQSHSDSENANYADRHLYHMDPNTLPGVDLFNALYSAQTLEVFQYVEGFFGEPFCLSKDEYSSLLAHYTELGNIAIVRYLLDRGARIDGGRRTDLHPLVIACRNCHEDIVDLLLECGADPGYPRPLVLGCPLSAATSGGSISIVRKLLSRGASFAEVSWDPVHIALRLEHTALVELILSHDKWTEKELRAIASQQEEKGLDSMASLLLSKI